MAVMLKQIDEVYIVDGDEEASNLVDKEKEKYNITKTSITFKYKKSEERGYYIVTLRKTFHEEE